MFLKRTVLLLALAATLGLTGAAAAAATSAPGHASLLIRHQTRGCHTWSANGDAFKASQSIALRRGGWLAVTNNDVMPHTLVLTSGPALRIAHPKLGHMGASLKITLIKPGVYHFTTKAGEDYMSGMKTIGEDNVLRLTVVVS
jgi:plastocyanin